MKTNKITLMVMGLALASLVASCKKNEGGNNVNVGEGFHAVLEHTGGNDTRTEIDPNWASDGSADLLWTSGDQILVANQSGAEGCTKLTYTLASGAHSSEGDFASNDENDAFFRPDYVAIYPAANTNDVANDINGTTATFNLPQTQIYQAKSFGEKAMPMVAYSNESKLQFKNVLGGICFPLTGNEGAMVTRIVLTSNANEALWGSCPVTISNTGADPEVGTITNDAASKNVITLDCSANGGVALSSTPTYFCIVVPPGTLEGGFMVQAFDGSVNVLEKSTTANPGSGFITRNSIKKANGNLQVGSVPEGALKGTFTVNANGDKIYFSKGTLRYKPSEGRWRFADVQYDRLHTEAEGSSLDVTNEYQPDYDGWIELFGWGCTGQQDSRSTDQQYFLPYETNTGNSAQYGPTGELDLSVEYGSDFGAVPVENGDGYGWRMFSFEEVQYMMGYRQTDSGMRFAFVNVHGNIAVIILPDEWDSNLYPLEGTDTFGSGIVINNVSDEDWTNILEANGVMLMILPGGRIGTTIYMDSDYGLYWTSTAYSVDQAVCPLGSGNTNILQPWPHDRSYGGVIRLVRDVPRP